MSGKLQNDWHKEKLRLRRWIRNKLCGYPVDDDVTEECKIGKRSFVPKNETNIWLIFSVIYQYNWIQEYPALRLILDVPLRGRSRPSRCKVGRRRRGKQCSTSGFWNCRGIAPILIRQWSSSIACCCSPSSVRCSSRNSASPKPSIYLSINLPQLTIMIERVYHLSLVLYVYCNSHFKLFFLFTDFS